MGEYRHGRGQGGAILLARACPDHPTRDALAAHLAVLFSAGHQHAVSVFGEGYEARLPILAGPVPEGGVE